MSIAKKPSLTDKVYWAVDQTKCKLPSFEIILALIPKNVFNQRSCWQKREIMLAVKSVANQKRSHLLCLRLLTILIGAQTKACLLKSLWAFTIRYHHICSLLQINTVSNNEASEAKINCQQLLKNSLETWVLHFPNKRFMKLNEYFGGTNGLNQPLMCDCPDVFSY